MRPALVRGVFFLLHLPNQTGPVPRCADPRYACLTGFRQQAVGLKVICAVGWLCLGYCEVFRCGRWSWGISEEPVRRLRR